MGLAIPKFLEAILPLAFGIGAIYTAHRMIIDRETIIMSAAGASTFNLSKGFLIFAGMMMLVQFALSGWISPIAVEKLQKTRTDVQSHLATVMFREGIFNSIGNDLTVYVKNRKGLNELENLMIHDGTGAINKGKETTIIAKRGIVNLGDNNQQLLVYNGTQYQKDIKTGNLSQLDFAQYSLDIPSQKNTIGVRWQEPDERTFDKLFISEDTSTSRDIGKKTEFIAEIHKRISTPFLYLSFIFMIIISLFLGTWNRRNQTAPIVFAGISIIVIQSLYIVMYNESRDIAAMNLGLYTVTILPIMYGVFRILKNQKSI